MIEPRYKEIDGVRYRFQPLFAKAARNQLDQLIQKFGPTFATAVKGLQKSEDFDMDADILKALPAVAGSVGSAIETFCASLAPNYHAALVSTFIVGRVAIVGDTEAEMRVLTEQACEELFATSLMTETKILIWCLEEQYSDFFALLRKGATFAVLSRAAKTASPSASRNSSTGISTGLPQAGSITIPS